MKQVASSRVEKAQGKRVVVNSKRAEEKVICHARSFLSTEHADINIFLDRFFRPPSFLGRKSRYHSTRFAPRSSSPSRFVAFVFASTQIPLCPLSIFALLPSISSILSFFSLLLFYPPPCFRSRSNDIGSASTRRRPGSASNSGIRGRESWPLPPRRRMQTIPRGKI